MVDLIADINDNYVIDYINDEHGNPICAHFMTKEDYILKKLSDKIESIVKLEKDGIYLITIKDGTPEDVADITESLRMCYEKFGCHMIVVSDKITFEEINDYLQKALGGVK